MDETLTLLVPADNPWQVGDVIQAQSHDGPYRARVLARTPYALGGGEVDLLRLEPLTDED